VEDLLQSIVGYLEKHPSCKAMDVARALKVTRKEVNSLLYRGSRTTFTSVGTDPPLWSLRSGQETRETRPDAAARGRTPIQIAKDAGIEDRRGRVIEVFENQALLGGQLTMKYGAVSIDVILVERSLSDPYVTFELEGFNQMSVVVNTTMIPERQRTSIDGIIQHITHCVADSLSLRAMQDSSGVLDREDIFSIKSSVLAELTSTMPQEIAR
jgi:Adenosine deaminase z-alpha domain